MLVQSFLKCSGLSLMGYGNCFCLWCERRVKRTRHCVSAERVLASDLWPADAPALPRGKAFFDSICCRSCITQLRDPYLVDLGNGSAAKAFVRPSRFLKDPSGQGLPGLFAISFFPKGTQIPYPGKLVSADALEALQAEKGVAVSLLWAKGASAAIGYGALLGQLSPGTSKYAVAHRINTKKSGDKFKTNAHWGSHRLSASDIQHLDLDPGRIPVGCSYPCITIGPAGVLPGHEILVNTYGSAYWTKLFPREMDGSQPGQPSICWWRNRFLTPKMLQFLDDYDAKRHSRPPAQVGQKRKAITALEPQTVKRAKH